MINSAICTKEAPGGGGDFSHDDGWSIAPPKEKKKERPAGDGEARLNDRKRRNDFLRATGLSGGPMINGPAPLFAAADPVAGVCIHSLPGPVSLSVEHPVGPDPPGQAISPGPAFLSAGYLAGVRPFSASAFCSIEPLQIPFSFQTIFSGLTVSSNSSAVRRPSVRTASFKVVPSWRAFFAHSAAFS